ncbi:uncharacterized protein [Spinacia oleracea]|uniref:Uncharacterized protein isoform X2 n=1 Tax=Spinacia oleracea TaxID=3562 RepID=A0A9R0I4T7_SPIOL|nr:uncharacterized protein LOC110782440 isoform X2 [Spinacia oleracea]
MGSNMVPCSRLRKRSKTAKRSELVVSKQSKVLKVKEESGIDFEFELFSCIMTDQLLTEILICLPDDSVCRFKLMLFILCWKNSSLRGCTHQNIVWRGLGYSCTANMVPGTATSSPHSGHAFAIFKTPEAAKKIIGKLALGCLMLPNGRLAEPGIIFDKKEIFKLECSRENAPSKACIAY